MAFQIARAHPMQTAIEARHYILQAHSSNHGAAELPAAPSMLEPNLGCAVALSVHICQSLSGSGIETGLQRVDAFMGSLLWLDGLTALNCPIELINWPGWPCELGDFVFSNPHLLNEWRVFDFDPEGMTDSPTADIVNPAYSGWCEAGVGIHPT